MTKPSTDIHLLNTCVREVQTDNVYSIDLVYSFPSGPVFSWCVIHADHPLLRSSSIVPNSRNVSARLRERHIVSKPEQTCSKNNVEFAPAAVAWVGVCRTTDGRTDGPVGGNERTPDTPRA